MASRKKVGLCIDGDNFYHTQKKHLFFDIDAAKLLKWCEKYGDITAASYYLSIYEDSDEDRQGFARALMNIGYRVVRVPVKKINTSEGEKTKSKVDNHILLDIPSEKDYWDILILCSGDSDLEDLIRRLQANEKRVIVLSTSTAVSEEVRMMVGHDYVDLLDIKNNIQREYHDPAPENGG